MTTLPPLETIAVGGLSVGYRRAGDGPPLVLLHGGFCDSRVWAPQLAGLADEFTVYAPEAPGFGASDNPPETWTADDYANHLASVLDALGLVRPVVVGLSFGSIMALLLYRQRPEAVGALVLASAYAGWAGSLPPEEVQRRLEGSLRDLDDPERIVATWLPTWFTPDVDPQIREYAAEMIRDFHPAGQRTALRALGPLDLHTVLGTITAPTLLLYGDADVRSPVESVGKELHAAIPGSELGVVPGGPHVLNLELPDAFNHAVRNFAHHASGGPGVVCRRWISAINDHDLDTIADCFAENYEDEAPARRGEHVHGRAQVRRNFGRLLADVPDLHSDLRRTAVSGQTVWLEWRMSGTRADGTGLEFVGVNVFDVENDRFRTGRIYTELVRDAGGIDAQLTRMTTGTGVGDRGPHL